MYYIGRYKDGRIFRLKVKNPIVICKQCEKKYFLEDANIYICEPLGVAIDLAKIHEKCPLLEE
jgi:hypothetical protein